MAGSALRTWHRSNEDLYQPYDVSTILTSISHKKNWDATGTGNLFKVTHPGSGETRLIPSIQDGKAFKWQGRKAETKHVNMKWVQEEANMAVQKTVQFSECIQQKPTIWPGETCLTLDLPVLLLRILTQGADMNNLKHLTLIPFEEMTMFHEEEPQRHRIGS